MKSATKTKKRLRRKPGLWFGARRIEIEAVKKAHKMECCVCRERPTDLRMLVKDGSGKNQVARVFCRKDGVIFLNAIQQEAEAAILYLVEGTTETGIRLMENGSQDFGADWLKEKALARKRKKEQRQQA